MKAERKSKQYNFWMVLMVLMVLIDLVLLFWYTNHESMEV